MEKDLISKVRVAFLVDDTRFVLDKYVGAKYGGGRVVLQNVLMQLLELSYSIDIYTYKDSVNNSLKNVNVFKVVDEKDFNEKFDVSKYTIIITTSTRFGVQINYFLQGHSKKSSLLYYPKLIAYVLGKLHKSRLSWEVKSFTPNGDFRSYVAVSKLVAQDYCTNFGISEDSIRVIYPGCEQRNELDVIKNKDVITFGIIANSSLNKGGHLFLLVVGVLKYLGVEFKVNMIAPKYNDDFLMKYIVLLFGLKKCLKIFPKQDVMDDFYKSIDCLVMPSKRETFGLVALEAMSFGKPIIISDTTGICEIIDDKVGFIFKRASILQFIKVLNKFVKLYVEDFELYEAMCRNAYRLSQKYTWEAFCEKLLEK